MKKIIMILSAGLFFAACNNPETVEQTAKPLMENVITLSDAQMKNASVETGKIQQKQLSSGSTICLLFSNAISAFMYMPGNNALS